MGRKVYIVTMEYDGEVETEIFNTRSDADAYLRKEYNRAVKEFPNGVKDGYITYDPIDGYLSAPEFCDEDITHYEIVEKEI